ncbi:MAG TPA: DUF429 domain-containing protein [Blastocatellia bacterium]|nr:DUF429 domain-containing protein [Blastocatellia bacterium]
MRRAFTVMFSNIFGLDFSGARLAGRNTWIARLEPSARGRRRPAHRLAELSSLEDLCGTAGRGAALAHLVSMVRLSDQALWALDFPFGLPIEVMREGARWPDQLDFLYAWGDDDYGVGLECLRRAKSLGGPNHIRRLTDIEAKAPFDPYHYRISYQTFYGMRDVLGPLWRRRHTAILPFQYRRLVSARRVLVEACPDSTLKRMGLPHQNYKQPEGGPLTAKRRRTRHVILEGLAERVSISDSQRRTIMRNGGGDALDAVITALGAVRSWGSCDHRQIYRHPRYPREGRLYV